MASNTPRKRELKNIGYELFIGALSVLSIINLVLLYFLPDNSQREFVIYTMNTIMMPIFLGDFLYRFFTAESRSGYFWRKFGWADLLSSLPFPQAKILRLFRLWRVARLFMEFGARNLLNQFVEHRAENALLTVGFLVLVLIEWGSIAVLRAESTNPDANITNASDAIWWVYVTITTVGYGDRFPTTNQGRIIGMVVMTAGVGLFGTLSGYLANQFLTPPKKREEVAETTDGADTPVDEPRARLAELMQLIEAQEQSTAELKAKVEEVSKLL